MTTHRPLAVPRGGRDRFGRDRFTSTVLYLVGVVGLLSLLGSLAACGSTNTSPRPINDTADTLPVTSPQTPAGFRPAQPAPQTVDSVPVVGDGGIVTGPPASSAEARPGSFCTTLRSGLADVGNASLSALKSLATSTADQGPKARAVVTQAEATAARIKADAPAAVATAATTLSDAWSALAAQLKQAGYDRASLVTLSLKNATSSAVITSWAQLSQYASTNCTAPATGGSTARPS